MQIRAYQQSNLDKFGCIYNYNSLKPGWPLSLSTVRQNYLENTLITRKRKRTG
ncbi:hypothetical protein D3C81_875150 [compost metagenome]